MKRCTIFLVSFLLTFSTFAGTIEKVYYFNNYKINTLGTYQTVTLDNTHLIGIPGEPTLAYREFVLMLPAGETASSIEIIRENEVVIPGFFELFPQQNSLPISSAENVQFIKKENIYKLQGPYPSNPGGRLDTQYLNGYALAVSTFTPMVYNPALKTLSFYNKVTIKISTKSSLKSRKAMDMLTASESARKRVLATVHNPEMINSYPTKSAGREDYKLLIITPQQFENDYTDLLNFYNSNQKINHVQTTEYINANISGHDLQQKIRNYIKQEYINNNIEYVLLGGDIQFVPFRGFYCFAISQPNQEDYNIPADIYYSSLDGEWNDTSLVGGSVNKWGEPGEDDLYPEVAVARLTFNNANDLEHMIHKSWYYQQFPVLGESTHPYLAGEFLWGDPLTFGSDYIELLVNDHDDNGYFTHGIPSADNDITRLYDTQTYTWDATQLIAGINQGKSFIHHLGHANYDYMMRLFNSDISNSKFSQVDGITHNYTLIYTQGCNCGGFDQPGCIAEKAISIDNFAVAGVFNSRFGWFNQGTTDGPSEHLHREFVSALYNDTLEYQIKEIGAAHMMSKIKTAPWVGLPGEFEPGAQRWVHYDCNVLGDPALTIWTEEPNVGIPGNPEMVYFNLFPNPCTDKFEISCYLPVTSDVRIMLVNTIGQTVFNSFYPALKSGPQTLTIDLPELEQGIYYCRLQNGSSAGVKKITIIR